MCGHAKIQGMSDAQAGAPLTIHLLGNPRWQGAERSGSLGRLDAALLAVLALEPDTPRDRVASWLWPGSPLRGANVNLRQRLFKLRRATGHALVDAGATLRLAAGVVADVAMPESP